MSETVKVTINGQPRSFEAPLNLYDVLEQQDMIDMMIAVARNATVVPRSQWQETAVLDGDTLEIVAPMQGG